MAKKVICTLPNASDEINGVKFELVDGAAVAEVSDKVAEQFAGINGYTIEDVKAKSSAKKEEGGEQK